MCTCQDLYTALGNTKTAGIVICWLLATGWMQKFWLARCLADTGREPEQESEEPEGEADLAEEEDKGGGLGGPEINN